MPIGLTERKSLIIKFIQKNIFQDCHIPSSDAQKKITCEKVCRDKDKNVQKQDKMLRLPLLCDTEINT